MNELESVQLKDRILEYLLENDNSKAEKVYKALDNPFNNFEQFRIVAQDMFIHHHKYFKIRQGFQFDENDSGKIYYITNLTKSFIEVGGFTAIYDQKERDLLIEQKVKKASDKKTLYWWVPITISALSLCFSAYAISRNSIGVTQKEIKEVNNKIDSLKSNFKKENDKLKSRIYEAEMLIAVYENDSI
ncbi:hypothetical protein [Maribacter sp. 1_2014MBL_MicDiv]|uniref:hypothetical protein n=1 Tax=Maribacter sp. 1_2014MBL_MicDiv TaxID=1644130 RepID=UPI0008F480B8|nr:hypothetical protein [Maribacter sp. 1_2014MBL_MicDiv]APA65647.1 hypothetical protein YQ22_15795 [Maribacter sp. 1_2014MBL_MicDiv]